MSVSKEIKINGVDGFGFRPQIRTNQGAVAVIEYRESLTGHQAVLQLNGSVCAIQRTGSPLQVPDSIAIAPGRTVNMKALIQLDRQSLPGKGFFYSIGAASP